jgi:hypothetical protein
VTAQPRLLGSAATTQTLCRWDVRPRERVSLGQMASSTAALAARVRPGGPWQISNNVVTLAQKTYSDIRSSSTSARPTWACSARGVDGDVHHFYEPTVTTATNLSSMTGQQASNAAVGATDHRPGCPSTPSTRTTHGGSTFLNANPTERHGRLRANWPIGHRGQHGLSGSSSARSSSTTSSSSRAPPCTTRTRRVAHAINPVCTPAEHRAIRFLTFNQDALAALQRAEQRLQQLLCCMDDASGEQQHRESLNVQLARVRREHAAAVRGRHRAVAQLRAAEACAGRHHHRDQPRRQPRRTSSAHGGMCEMLDSVRGVCNVFLHTDKGLEPHAQRPRGKLC